MRGVLVGTSVDPEVAKAQLQHGAKPFEITVERATMRTLDLRMVTTAHFMHERYRSFDAPLSVKPPS